MCVKCLFRRKVRRKISFEYTPIRTKLHLAIIFKLLQRIKVPFSIIPLKYGRIIYGEDVTGVQFVWRNNLWPKIQRLYYAIDRLEVLFFQKYIEPDLLRRGCEQDKN